MTAAIPAAAGTDQALLAARRRSAPRAWLEAVRRRLAIGASSARPREGAEPRHAYPPAPEGETLYVIGDVHGRADCLVRAQARIDRGGAQAASRATEIYLGDYVDRGPDSKTVLDLMAARVRVKRVVALRGNHETAMESFLAGHLPFAAWRALGGAETLLSYGFAASDLRRAEGPRCEDFAERLPDDHRRFLASLGAFHRDGGYGFVHAGLRPGVALENQDVADLTGIRNEFLDDDGDFGFIVVHGHTPVERVDFRSNRINLDTGAYLSNRLSVLRIDAAGAGLLAPEAP
jgi:serine/threonine protein phosphatase 1